MIKKTFLSTLLISINLMPHLLLSMEQPSAESITIITNDGVRHEAHRDICIRSKTIKHCLKDLGGNEVHLPLLDGNEWMLAYEALQLDEGQTLEELYNWLFRGRINSWEERFSLLNSIDYLNYELFAAMWYVTTHFNYFIP